MTVNFSCGNHEVVETYRAKQNNENNDHCISLVRHIEHRGRALQRMIREI
jgi:hypothetical protein